jgi:peptide/nickel transport system permease protein
MIRYALSRIALALPTIGLALFLIFAMIRLIPGDPAQLILGDTDDAAALARLRASLALDQPLPIQFGHWVAALAQGDFGRSISMESPVIDLLLPAFGVTALLVIPAMVIATMLALPLGMFAAWRQNSRIDTMVVTLATIFLSVPSFWLGLMALLLFGVKLDLFPVVGYVSPFDDLLDGLHYLVLPVITLALIETGVLVRLVRASTIEALQLDYISHARAKGLSEFSVARRHALPNVMGPTWTMVGLALGGLLGGAVVIETVFSLPGLGRLMVEAVFARDYPVIQGCMVIVMLSYVGVNLAVELTAPLVCPALRYD